MVSMDVMEREEPSTRRAELVACLHRIAAQDKTALAQLYHLTSAKLFSLCLRILVDHGEAEDVLQEVYLRLWNKATQFDAARGLSPMTWLLTITRNRALDRLRAKRQRFAELDEASEIADELPLADQTLEIREASDRLYNCLAGLDVRAANAIRSAFFGGQTYESLAQQAAMPLGSMKSLVRRGLIRLKACLSS
jgi:RNA polymerase sigma-70 factor (ECF subfamily)